MSDELTGTQAGRDDLRAALEIARQQVEVAVSITPAIADMISRPADLLLVVADAVRRWRALDRSAQAPYVPDNHLDPVTTFAWEYIERVSDGAFVARPRRDYADVDEANAAEIQHWQQHVTRLRELAEGRPASPRRCPDGTREPR